MEGDVGGLPTRLGRTAEFDPLPGPGMVSEDHDDDPRAGCRGVEERGEIGVGLVVARVWFDDGDDGVPVPVGVSEPARHGRRDAGLTSRGGEFVGSGLRPAGCVGEAGGAEPAGEALGGGRFDADEADVEGVRERARRKREEQLVGEGIDGGWVAGDGDAGGGFEVDKEVAALPGADADQGRRDDRRLWRCSR